MSEEKETFENVLHSIRSTKDCASTDPGYRHIQCRYAKDWCKRLKAAHEREILKYRTHACHDDGLMTTMSLEICNLRQALREALSGIDEFMTRTIYHEHGKDIERWRSVLAKEGESK